MSLEQMLGRRTELESLLIAKNKEFTLALKSKKPHAELVVLFQNIKNVYNELNGLRDKHSFQKPQA